jgi:hypothetical protein
MSITGGCLCRAVRYRCDAPPIAARICWCRVCQYLAAGSGTVNVCLPNKSFMSSGTPVIYTSISDSGNTMRRHFCGRCGSPLFSTADARPHLIFVRAGTLDDPGAVTPGSTIWVSQAPAWACIDPALPQFPGQPPPL